MLRFFSLLIFLLIITPLLSFAATSALSGAVFDNQGHPLPDSVVYVYKQGDTKPEFQQTTDDQGVYTVKDIPLGNYLVTCTRDGFKPQTKTVEVKKWTVAGCYFNLDPVAGSVGPTISSTVFRIGQVDLDTTRVYVAFGSDSPSAQETIQQSAQTGKFSSDLPFTNLSDLGAILYGANPSKTPLMNLILHNGANDPNQLLPTIHPDSIIMLDTKKDQAVASIPTTSRPFWIAFSPDGQRFWVVDGMHNLTMYSAKGDRLASVNLGDDLVSDLAVSPDGTRVYLAMRSWPDPEVLVVDGVSNSVVGSYSLPTLHGQPGGVAVAMDGRTLVVSMGTQAAGWLEVLDAPSGQVTKEIQIGAEPMGVGVTPDGSRAVVTCYADNVVDIVDLQKGSILASLSTGLEPAKVAMRSDGRVAFVTNNGDDSMSVIDVAQAVELAKVPVGKGPMGVAISQDGKTVYVANSDDGDVSIIDGMTLAVLATTSPVEGEHPFGIAIRP